jgi:hypothetical protein
MIFVPLKTFRMTTEEILKHQGRKYKKPEPAKNLPGEEWRQIPTLPKQSFWFSNLGRVKRDLVLQSGQNVSTIKQPVNTGSSVMIELSFGIIKYSSTVARFILLAWQPIENHSEYYAVNLNHNKTDNRIENLKWMSRKELIEWRKENPLPRKQFNKTKQYRNNRGQLRTRKSAFTNSDHSDIFRLRKEGYSQKHIAKQIGDGCTQQYVSKVLNGHIRTLIPRHEK